MRPFSLESVRLAQLDALGLLEPPAAAPTRETLLDAIRRMGALQIDTIHVVARAPYFALFSRVGAYPAAWLDDLLAGGALFEYWSHAACFLPIEDYPFYRARMLAGDYPWRNAERWRADYAGLVERVLGRIRAEGPLRSVDFEPETRRPGTWWSWKDEKIALELLHTMGDLMIARRERFQRVYDLRERVLPDWDDARALPLHDARRELAYRGVRALGVAHPAWVADYYRLARRSAPVFVRELVESGRVVEVPVEGWEAPGLAAVESLPRLEEVAAGRLRATLTTLLTPFDPLVWDRERARMLFGFDYTIECYTPAPKRRFGYFSLPVLHRGRLVGRLDAKAHRKDRRFEVKRMVWEEGLEVTAQMRAEVRAAVQACADWHAAPQVEGWVED